MEKRTAEILRILRRTRGVDLCGYRSQVFERILAGRLEALGMDDMGDYMDLFENDSLEQDLLVEALLIRVSEFFRDPLVFETLAELILPAVVRNNKEVNKNEIRIWCAGCATGEEAYSMAILVQEALRAESCWDVHLFATDISEQALEAARKGRYRAAAMGNVKLRLLERYFQEEGNEFRVLPKVAETVHFSVEDLMSRERVAPAASIFGEFDIVLCRNVLIYYELGIQRRILGKLCKTLGNKGYLVLGDSESLISGMNLPLYTADNRSRIYRKGEVQDGAYR